MLEDPSNIQYPSPSHGGPAVGGPGGPRLSLGTVMQVWRRLWTSYRWWTVGAAGVVVVLASTVVVVGLHGHNQADTSKGAEQPHHHDANADTGNSQDKAVSDTTSKDKTASTAADDKKSTKAGGQTGGSTGSTQPTGGGGDTSGSGNTGGCGGVVGAPGGTDPWSGCWPGSANTGVPAGTTLRRVPQDVTSGSGWSWNVGDQLVYVTGTSTVVSGLDVAGGFYVTGAGSTIKNSKANAISVAGAARSTANPRLTIQDSEVNCGNQGGSTAIGDLNFTVIRVNIHGCENGFDVDSDASITDSYIHDLYNSIVGDPHTDGLQSAVGSNLTITHNVFYGFTTGCAYPNNGSCNGTSAININNNPSGPHSSNTLVNKNLFAGGAYALYCPKPSTINFQVLDNHFSRVYSPNVGEFGPASDCSDDTQAGNVIHETGQTLSLD